LRPLKKQTIIIIPAYNEEKNIAGVINGIKNVIPDADILVVNDGGEDRTEEIVRGLGEQVIGLPLYFKRKAAFCSESERQSETINNNNSKGS